jgi:hypothetical protein
MSVKLIEKTGKDKARKDKFAQSYQKSAAQIIEKLNESIGFDVFMNDYGFFLMWIAERPEISRYYDKRHKKYIHEYVGKGVDNYIIRFRRNFKAEINPDYDLLFDNEIIDSGYHAFRLLVCEILGRDTPEVFLDDNKYYKTEQEGIANALCEYYLPLNECTEIMQRDKKKYDKTIRAVVAARKSLEIENKVQPQKGFNNLGAYDTCLFFWFLAKYENLHTDLDVDSNLDGTRNNELQNILETFKIPFILKTLSAQMSKAVTDMRNEKYTERKTKKKYLERFDNIKPLLLDYPTATIEVNKLIGICSKLR